MTDVSDALIHLERHQTQLDMDGVMVGVSRQALDILISFAHDALDAAETAKPGRDEADEAYEIGLRDGYENAVQEIDIATGGDGEFKGSTFPGETVDVPVMRQRIVDRLYTHPAPVPPGYKLVPVELLDEAIRLFKSKRLALNSQFEAVDVLREDSIYSIVIEDLEAIRARAMLAAAEVK